MNSMVDANCAMIDESIEYFGRLTLKKNLIIVGLVAVMIGTVYAFYEFSGGKSDPEFTLDSEQKPVNELVPPDPNPIHDESAPVFESSVLEPEQKDEKHELDDGDLFKTMTYTNMRRQLLSLINGLNYFEKQESAQFADVLSHYIQGMTTNDIDSSRKLISSKYYPDTFTENSRIYRNIEGEDMKPISAHTNGHEIIIAFHLDTEDSRIERERFFVLDTIERKVTFDGPLLGKGIQNINFLYSDFEWYYLTIQEMIAFDSEFMIDKIEKNLPEGKALLPFIFSIYYYVHGMMTDDEILINSYTDFPHDEKTKQQIEESTVFFKSVEDHDMRMLEIESYHTATDYTLELTVVFEKDNDRKFRKLILKEHDQKIIINDEPVSQSYL